MKWEYDEVIRQKKQFSIVKLEMNAFLPTYLKKYSSQIVQRKDLSFYLHSKVELQINPDILLDQYKMMVSSTEKVSEQRLKVNNLFVTITTTLLSLSLLIGKALDFNTFAIIGMIFFAIMALGLTFFWEKLVNSYGKLNKGKFKIIDEIEQKLNTNLFQREWEVLQKEVKYESNTVTELNIIKGFRIFILVIMIAEISYLCYSSTMNITTQTEIPLSSPQDTPQISPDTTYDDPKHEEIN